MKSHLSKIIALLLILYSVSATAEECVVLLHGLAKSDRSMQKVERNLLQEGYIVVNVSYPSRENNIEELANIAISPAVDKCTSQSLTAINFVTHSLGGILVRQYLSDHKLPKLGRVVMLAPPNGGSELVDKFKEIPGFKQVGGPASVQLGTGSESLPRKLGPVDFELGVIAGDRTFNPILSMFFLPSRDDGKVTIENAKVEGMLDFIVMPTSHVFIMKNKKVISQIVAFLKNGKFSSGNI